MQSQCTRLTADDDATPAVAASGTPTNTTGLFADMPALLLLILLYTVFMSFRTFNKCRKLNIQRELGWNGIF